MTDINMMVYEALEDKANGIINHYNRYKHVYSACIGAACFASRVIANQWPETKVGQFSGKAADTMTNVMAAYKKTLK